VQRLYEEAFYDVRANHPYRDMEMAIRQEALARLLMRLSQVPRFREHFGERVRTLLRSRPIDHGARVAGSCRLGCAVAD